jgi:Delta24-sterol reductase
MLVHQQKVQLLANQVRLLRKSGIPGRVYHGNTNSTRTLRFKKNEVVDISDLNRVLRIDKEKRTVLVEPNVPMDKLVAETLRDGLIPAIVPEFPGITVGGAVAGGSGESSSFKYGLVHNLALSYELVLGSGEIINASRESHPDLFSYIGGTCGSIAIITAIELKLIPATAYIKLEYIPVTSPEDLAGKMHKFSQSGADFIDAIIFSHNEGVVIVGHRTEGKQGLPVQRFTRSWDNWFYLHAQKVARQGERE